MVGNVYAKKTSFILGVAVLLVYSIFFAYFIYKIGDRSVTRDFIRPAAFILLLSTLFVFWLAAVNVL